MNAISTKRFWLLSANILLYLVGLLSAYVSIAQLTFQSRVIESAAKETWGMSFLVLCSLFGVLAQLIVPPLLIWKYWRNPFQGLVRPAQLLVVLLIYSLALNVSLMISTESSIGILTRGH